MVSEHARGNPRRSRTAGAALFFLVLCVEIYVIAGSRVELPRTPLTGNSFLVDGLAKGVGISQTTTIRAGGFNEVVFSVAPIGEVHSGKLNWSLHEVERVSYGRCDPQNPCERTVEREDRFLYRDVVRAQAVLEAGELVLRFPVIDESKGRSYRLDVWPADARVQNGIGLWATDGWPWTEGGSMLVNGLGGFSEFVYEARATRVTVWDDLRHYFGGLGLTALLFLAVCAHGALFAVIQVLGTPSPLATDGVVS